MFLYDNCVISGNKGIAKAFAKVNLTLDVLGKREDGYHSLETIMRAVNLYDTITICLNDTGVIKLTSDAEHIPTDQRNIAYKAARRYLNFANSPKGMTIHIKKVIPSGAGMGGGSADGAAVLVLLNKLFNDKVSPKDLLTIGANIGADVPFCMMCGTHVATGIGEILSPVKVNDTIPILVVKPEVSISTPEMYKMIDNSYIINRPDTSEMIKALEKGDIYSVASKLCNVMEPVAISVHKEIETIKNKMLENGALGAMMTGSGSAVFGIFETAKAAEECSKIFINDYKDVYSTELL